MCRQAGAHVDDPVRDVFNGQEVEVWPRVIWKPKWGVTFSEIKNKVSGSCSVSQKSTLVIKGRNVFLKDLSLDGTLIIDSIDDAEVYYIKFHTTKYIRGSCEMTDIFLFCEIFYHSISLIVLDAFNSLKCVQILISVYMQSL